jgi:hypothetical protein
MDSPRVSILIATYNRSALLPRAIKSVLKQDFEDFEIIVIDDCSTDDTPQVMAGFTDPRIRCIRNDVNQGAKFGDRMHVRRCVHELMRGRFFIYLCDDDFWLPVNLLSQHIAAFEQYPSLSISIGGQAQTFDRDFGLLADPNLGYVQVMEVSPLTFHARKVYPAGFIPRRNFLALFAESTMRRNIVVGATMFSRDAFIKAGVFSDLKGSRWQAGYEFFIGPTVVGDAFYIDAPCVISAVERENASFRGTQLDHYRDCIRSVEVACRSVAPVLTPEERLWLDHVRHSFFYSLTDGFVANRISFKKGWFDNHAIDHSGMFEENVTAWQVAKVYAANRLLAPPRLLRKALYGALPTWFVRNKDDFVCRLSTLPHRVVAKIASEAQRARVALRRGLQMLGVLRPNKQQPQRH